MKVPKEIGSQRKHQIEHDRGLLLIDIIIVIQKNLSTPSKG